MARWDHSEAHSSFQLPDLGFTVHTRSLEQITGSHLPVKLCKRVVSLLHSSSHLLSAQMPKIARLNWSTGHSTTRGGQRNCTREQTPRWFCARHTYYINWLHKKATTLAELQSTSAPLLLYAAPHL